jgi:hypothetical protein
MKVPHFQLRRQDVADRLQRSTEIGPVDPPSVAYSTAMIVRHSQIFRYASSFSLDLSTNV